MATVSVNPVFGGDRPVASNDVVSATTVVSSIGIVVGSPSVDGHAVHDPPRHDLNLTGPGPWTLTDLSDIELAKSLTARAPDGTYQPLFLVS